MSRFDSLGDFGSVRIVRTSAGQIHVAVVEMVGSVSPLTDAETGLPVNYASSHPVRKRRMEQERDLLKMAKKDAAAASLLGELEFAVDWSTVGGKP